MDSVKPDRRPTVLLDCDGVLSDFVGAYLKILGATTSRWFTREQITHFDIGKSLGLSAPDSAAMKREIGSFPNLAAVLEVCHGAVDGVRALREIADVFIVTSPWNSNPTWTYDRERWLKQHFDIHHRDVIHCSAKHLVRGDVFVDDKTEMVLRWGEANPGRAVRWITPHNRLDGEVTLETGLWSELLSIVETVRR